MAPGAFSVAAAGYAAPSGAEAAAQNDGRPSPQGNEFRPPGAVFASPPSQVQSPAPPLVTGGSAPHLVPVQDPRVAYGGPPAHSPALSIWAPSVYNASAQGPPAMAQGQHEPVPIHPPQPRPVARRVAFSPSPAPPQSPSHPRMQYPWGAVPPGPRQDRQARPQGQTSYRHRFTTPRQYTRVPQVPGHLTTYRAPPLHRLVTLTNAMESYLLQVLLYVKLL